MPIVWENPDGSIQITQLTETYLERERLPNETTADTVMRLALVEQAKTPRLQGLTPRLVVSAQVPTSRTDRYKWRLQGAAVVPDPAVPDRPHPRQALLDAINGAATVDDLKAALMDMLRPTQSLRG